MNQKNEKRIEIGSLWTVRAPWYDRGLGRMTTIGEIVMVHGMDRGGDPIFVPNAPADLEGSVYASDFIDRTDFYGPPKAAPEDPSPLRTYTIAVDREADGRYLADVSEVPGAMAYGATESEATNNALAIALERFEPAPAVEPDRKPRGVKPPMALIPWDVVPEPWIPEAVQTALETPDEAEEGPESFAARVIRILLETSADDLLPEVARVMGHGAAKYGADNWQTATWDPDARREYASAMLRHLYADAIGEPHDPDSGLRHKAHAVASALILEWHDRRAARGW